ncbi:MAG: MunI family type II restriction endonuclease [Bdellovibrionales bacterium]|nr:MunI family type II restriction endonuclease [Bdellovibrionales bacterium]
MDCFSDITRDPCRVREIVCWFGKYNKHFSYIMSHTRWFFTILGSSYFYYLFNIPRPSWFWYFPFFKN